MIPSNAGEDMHLKVFIYHKNRTFMVRNHIFEIGKFSIIEVERKNLVMVYGKSQDFFG